METIAFFGASVTQQKEGYVFEFKKRLDPTKYTVIQEGYGSMHLNDAGICFINKIVAAKPAHCFIEWFSTGLILDSYSCLSPLLDCIVRKLRSINAQICFLMVDRNPMEPRRDEYYRLVKQYARTYDIHCIDLSHNANVSELLRDAVHTTAAGSAYYGRRVHEYFSEQMTLPVEIECSLPPASKYDDIKMLEVNKTVFKHIVFKGDFAITGIYQKIGPFSGVIEIDRDGHKTTESIWDQWCHYERQSMKIHVSKSKSLKITVLQDSFDSSACKVAIDFSAIVKRMEICKIFYLGSFVIEEVE